MRRWLIIISFIFLSVAMLLLSGCGGNVSSSQTTQAATNPTNPTNPSTPSNPAPQPQPTPTPTPTPSTPAGAILIDNVQNTHAWLTCGACGNDGATGSVAANSFTPGIATPSEDGVATQFSIAATVPYTNTYWYQQHAPIHTELSFLMYEFDLYIPAGSENAPQAIEFECQETLGGYIYNFGWQAIYTLNDWRIFNYGAKRWESANIPFTHFTPGTWHHIVAEYHNDAATHSVFHDALTVDGTRYPVNIRHDAFFVGDMNDHFTNAIQLDSNLHSDAYSVYVDKMRITYK